MFLVLRKIRNPGKLDALVNQSIQCFLYSQYLCSFSHGTLLRIRTLSHLNKNKNKNWTVFFSTGHHKHFFNSIIINLKIIFGIGHLTRITVSIIDFFIRFNNSKSCGNAKTTNKCSGPSVPGSWMAQFITKTPPSRAPPVRQGPPPRSTKLSD